jgi:hypothetical protein
LYEIVEKYGGERLRATTDYDAIGNTEVTICT